MDALYPYHYDTEVDSKLSELLVKYLEENKELKPVIVPSPPRVHVPDCQPLNAMDGLPSLDNFISQHTWAAFMRIVREMFYHIAFYL